MTTARKGHTATLLPDGRVLIVGGNSGGPASAELYDPLTGTFAATGNLSQALVIHRATLLQDGKTLVTSASGLAELYDPATGSFTVTGKMIAARENHTATLLRSGKVLVTGSSSVAELYDPLTGSFTATGSSTDSSIGAAVLLLDGRVLRTGFYATEIYDPATGTFSIVGPSLGGLRQDFTSTLLPSGSVFFTGGWNPFNCETIAFADSELYLPETGKFQSAGSMSVARAHHTGTLLLDGTVLIAGGFSGGYCCFPDNRNAEIYIPDAGVFVPTGSMRYERSGHTATLLKDGRVLVTGGGGSTGAQASAELYTPGVPGTVQVTVQTAPTGLQIAVDGTTYTAPQAFVWYVGSNHTIATTTPQGGGGTRRLFANWNDGGAISHAVAAKETTYTANFTTQYALTTGVAPAGSGTISTSPSSADGYYDSGTRVQLSAFPNFGYAFSSWSGDVSGSSNPVLLFMSGPKNVAANFNIVPVSGLKFVPVNPCRVADTRNVPGPFGGPVMAANSKRNFTIPASTCGIPTTARAYSLNVTVAPTTGTLGYLSIWPAGQLQPLVSTLNSTDGRIKANAAIVGAGTGGAVSVYVLNESQVILDINGYFAASDTSGLAFYPVTPCRVMDTRLPVGPLGGPILSGEGPRNVPVLSSTCGLPVTAVAYSLNMTVAPTNILDYLTTWPSGTAQPLVSTLNDLTGTVVANAAIVPAGTAGSINVFATRETHLIIDVNGYFAPPGPGGLLFYVATPCRVVDTRSPTSPFGGPALLGLRDFSITAGSCGMPATTKAYSLNAAVIPHGPLGYLALWPAGQPQPVVSTLNSNDASIVSNAAILPTTTGAISAFSSDTTDLILDLNGFFAP